MFIGQWREYLVGSDLSSKTKLVGLVLSTYWRPNGKIYPSLPTLEQACSLTRNTILKALSELRLNKYIRIKKGHIHGSSFISNIYELIGVTSEQMNEQLNKQLNEQLTSEQMNEHEEVIVKKVKKKKTNKKESPSYDDGVREYISFGKSYFQETGESFDINRLKLYAQSFADYWFTPNKAGKTMWEKKGRSDLKATIRNNFKDHTGKIKMYNHNTQSYSNTEQSSRTYEEVEPVKPGVAMPQSIKEIMESKE